MDFGAPKYVPVRQFLLDSSSAGRVGTGPHPKLLKVLRALPMITMGGLFFLTGQRNIRKLRRKLRGVFLEYVIILCFMVEKSLKLLNLKSLKPNWKPCITKFAPCKALHVQKN